jgi:hypothetical protein
VNQSTKTVFIHIGASKTGTTAIQNCLSSNSELLKANGVFYPMDPYFLEGPEIARNHAPLSCGNGIQFFYHLTNQPWFDSTTFFQKLADVLVRPYRTFVFSCEILQYGDAAKFASWYKFFEKEGIRTKFVFSVRDVTSHALSSWRQLVIYEGETLDWSGFLSKYANDYSLNTFDRTLQALSESVRREDIIVLNYSKLGRGLTQRFFDLCGEDYNNYQAATVDNPSDDDLTIDTMLYFNRMIAPLIDQSERKATAYRFYRTVLRQVRAIPSLPKSDVLLSFSEYLTFKAAMQPRVDYVNNNFLTHAPIVVASPEQVGRSGRRSYRGKAGRLAKKTAASLAGELPSLAVVRDLPVGLVDRVARLIHGHKFGRRQF